MLKRLRQGDKYAELRNEIRKIVSDNCGRYGYRRVTAELRKNGCQVNHKLVMRLMQEEGLTSRVRMKKYRSYRGEVGTAAPNIIDRDFTSERPYRKLTTDITEFSLFGRKLYLSPILDMYNGEIIAYELSERPVLAQVMDMLKKAYTVIPDTNGCILHSDQGWQYRNRKYQESLKQHGLIQSMSRKGNCLDNSVMENFFGHLKTELLYLREFSSYDEFVQELKAYIEYYNTRRIKKKLNYLSPVEYRLSNTKAA